MRLGKFLKHVRCTGNSSRCPGDFSWTVVKIKSSGAGLPEDNLSQKGVRIRLCIRTPFWDKLPLNKFRLNVFLLLSLLFLFLFFSDFEGMKTLYTHKRPGYDKQRGNEQRKNKRIGIISENPDRRYLAGNHIQRPISE